jgi:hypothetical protein
MYQEKPTSKGEWTGDGRGNNREREVLADESEPEIFAAKNLQRAEADVEKLGVGGMDRIDGIERSSGLSVPEIAAVRASTRIFEKIENFEWEARALLARMGQILEKDPIKEARLLSAGIGLKVSRALSKVTGNQPIKPGEIFSPVGELNDVRRLPKEQRAEALLRFKARLAYNKEGLARLQEDLIQKIKANPDLPRHDLRASIETLAKEYGLTFSQKQAARLFLNSYGERHANIRAVREQYTDDGELYQALFKRAPKGNVKIKEGPITLYVRCANQEDYAWIHSQSFLAGREMGEKEISTANMSGGVSISHSMIPDLAGAITAENSSHISPGYSSVIMEHEEQHAMKKIFGRRVWESEKFGTLWKAKNEEEFRRGLRQLLRREREVRADDHARDEIIAYFKEGRSAEQIFANLAQPESAGGLYDYIAATERESEDYFQAVAATSKINVMPIIKEEQKRTWDNEYKRLIMETVGIPKALREKGYSTEEVIALLIHEPLSRWTRVVERLSPQKKNKSARK